MLKLQISKKRLANLTLFFLMQSLRHQCHHHTNIHTEHDLGLTFSACATKLPNMTSLPIQTWAGFEITTKLLEGSRQILLSMVYTVGSPIWRCNLYGYSTLKDVGQVWNINLLVTPFSCLDNIHFTPDFNLQCKAEKTASLRECVKMVMQHHVFDFYEMKITP